MAAGRSVAEKIRSITITPTMKATLRHGTVLVCLASICLSEINTARETAVLDLAAFGAKADGSDTTPAVRAALAELGKGKATKLVFPPGRYAFHSERAFEEYL
ncbi:MAG TPA: hypothetical protein VLO11_08335, partial [Luteolibacter sp.]|nr:hypothetical protein [Luteolibacter sp.]